MIFRKDSLLFYESEIIYIVMVILALPCIPILGSGISLLLILPFAVLIFVNPKQYNEFITVNETGIACQKAGKQLWAYDWSDIAELKRSSRFLMPSVEVIAYNQYGEAEQFAAPNHYFQLGRAAREALERYYKSTKHAPGQQQPDQYR